ASESAYSFDIENRSAVSVQYLAFENTNCPGYFSQPVMPLSPPLAPGEMRRVTTTVSTLNCGPNASRCFRLTLFDAGFTACCALEISPPPANNTADIYLIKSA